MKISNTVIALAGMIALCALVAAGAGLLWSSPGQPFDFKTVRGETIKIYGQGLYRFDTPLIATGFIVADAVTLGLAIPLLLIALWLYRRGSMRGGILLGGALAFFLYNYGSLAFGAAYNDLFLVYLALMSASLFALIELLASFDAPQLAARFTKRLPRRGIGIFLIGAGIALFAIWFLLSILPALLAGRAPDELKHYTTVITFGVDLGILAPAFVIAGRLVMQRAPFGDVLAAVLLVFTDVLGVSLLAMGVAQQRAGLMHIGQFIGFVVSFALLTLFALGFTFALLRDFTDEKFRRGKNEGIGL